MSWGLTRKRQIRRLAVRGAALAGALVLTATLAAALQVRRLRIEGTHRFPAAAIERVLEPTVGAPTLTARPEALRDQVLALPWVADARVSVSIDGTVRCAVTERVPVAIGVDEGAVTLLDADGRVLGPAADPTGLVTLEGFGPYPAEREVVLHSLDRLAVAWGAPIERARRLGPRDVELHFAGCAAAVVIDPNQPDGAAAARRVLAAWAVQTPVAPLRLDARVAGRVAVLPGAEPTAGESD